MNKSQQPELKLEKLKELLDYDPQTGVFTWRKRTGRSAKGKIAGTVRSNPKDPCFGYRYITVAKSRHAAHRIAWFYVHGVWPSGDIDHRDMVRDNNAIGNLRDATRGQNMANTRRPSHNTSGFKGVTFDKSAGMWVAQVQFNNHNNFIGHYSSAEEAHKAYCRRAQELFGPFFRAA